jgi:HlyD family secretion protein
MDRRIDKRSKKPLYLGGAAALITVLALAWFLADGTSTSFTLDGQRIRTAEVTVGMYEDYIPLRASVEPERTVYLDAIEGGRVDEILVEEGAFVEKVDRLQLKSDLIEIDFQVTKLTRLVKRYEELEGNQFISKTEYEDSRDELEYWSNRRLVTKESQAQDEIIRLAQIEQLEGSVTQLEKNLILARANLENLLIRAPRSGQLTSMNAELGESKARGERLGQIDDVERFKATALVNEFYLGRVRLGQQALLEIEGDEYRLEISKIYPEVQASQFEIDLRFLGEAPDDIRRGQTLQLRLVLGDTTEQATLLANGPFFNDTGGAWVFVLDPSGELATRRTVQLGRRNPNLIEVEAGLLPGDEVIISGYANFIEVDRLYIDR